MNWKYGKFNGSVKKSATRIGFYRAMRKKGGSCDE
jgi:hypothetical protein